MKQENKKLKEILAQKDEKFNRMGRKKDRDPVQKDRDLDIERRLWKNRAADWDLGDSTDLHRIEVFDGIISDKSSLHSDPVRQEKISAYFGAGRGVRDCLRQNAAVSRRRIQSV